MDIYITFSEEEVKRILEALKGDLVRNNNMNFQYLSKTANLGLQIENALRELDLI